MSAKKSKKNKTTASSVCRVNKNANYTVMSNYHLRSTNLSLKAIGLLSKVLSLPENWDYSNTIANALGSGAVKKPPISANNGRVESPDTENDTMD